MPESTMLLLDEVRLTLDSAAGPVNVLRGVSLAVDSGETVAVVGRSGSGKTSLMMIAAGLERPTGGRVLVGGAELGRLDEDGLARFRRDTLGIVFQNFHLVPTMTALENVAVPLELAGAADAFECAEAGLATVGLGHRLTHYPGQLSGGEQQRVALARAFVASPRLLLADEPTGNLDGETGKHVVDLVFSLAERHAATLVLITHDSEISRRCAREVRLVDGRIASDRRNGGA